MRKIIKLYCIVQSILSMLLGHMRMNTTGTLPPCWVNVPSLTGYFSWRLPLLVANCTMLMGNQESNEQKMTGFGLQLEFKLKFWFICDLVASRITNKVMAKACQISSSSAVPFVTSYRQIVQVVMASCSSLLPRIITNHFITFWYLPADHSCKMTIARTNSYKWLPAISLRLAVVAQTSL